MPNLSKKLQMLAIAGAVATATMAGFATPASARQVYTDCDRYRCYRVVCNDWGNNCRRVSSWRNDRSKARYERRDRDWDRGDRGDRYDRAGNRVYVCNRYGRDCAWVNVDRNGRYRDRNGVYLRIDLGR